jgi:hypothetical protein
MLDPIEPEPLIRLAGPAGFAPFETFASREWKVGMGWILLASGYLG